MKLRGRRPKHYAHMMLTLLSVMSCHGLGVDDHSTYDRTVLVYMAADNNLSFAPSGKHSGFHQQDIDEMISAAGDIPENSRLLVYVDDMDLPRILSIEQQNGRRPIAKVVHQYTNEHNSGDAETLRAAMTWMTDNFPSKSYALVLWSHGDAWLPAKSPVQRAVCLDSKSGKWMEIADIAYTLSAFPKLEFILFDACFMQSIEVAYELRNTTKYIIASPAEIPAPGAPYKRVVKSMFSPSTYATDIAEAYYQEYNEGKITITGREPDTYGVCLSVVNCNQLESLATATEQMVSKYVRLQDEISLTGVQRYFFLNWSTRPEYYDMNGYMKRLLTDATDYAIWKDAFDKAIVYKTTTPHWFSDYTGMEYIDKENYGGISCYVPQSSPTHSNLNQGFKATEWYHAAGWQHTGW